MLSISLKKKPCSSTARSLVTPLDRHYHTCGSCSHAVKYRAMKCATLEHSTVILFLWSWDVNPSSLSRAVTKFLTTLTDNKYILIEQTLCKRTPSLKQLTSLSRNSTPSMAHLSYPARPLKSTFLSGLPSNTAYAIIISFMRATYITHKTFFDLTNQ
jgi:hypothetical protein